MNLNATAGVLSVRYLGIFSMFVFVFAMMLYMHKLRENLANSFEKASRGKRRLSDIEEIEAKLSNPRKVTSTPSVPNFTATQFPIGCQQLMSIF
ncbi:hypothetical protein K7432_002860 [Basidiobolus ranarum]|uniref:Uncharacterized protein n=1 Tax=Basidiobolus ranarum TaxID=34480 RepID=A0ABR2W729_9FUNG